MSISSNLYGNFPSVVETENDNKATNKGPGLLTNAKIKDRAGSRQIEQKDRKKSKDASKSEETRSSNNASSYVEATHSKKMDEKKKSSRRGSASATSESGRSSQDAESASAEKSDSKKGSHKSEDAGEEKGVKVRSVRRSSKEKSASRRSSSEREKEQQSKSPVFKSQPQQHIQPAPVRTSATKQRQTQGAYDTDMSEALTCYYDGQEKLEIGLQFTKRREKVAEPQKDEVAAKLEEARQQVEQRRIEGSKLQKTGRRIYMIRHGEPVDAVFPGFCKLAFHEDTYKPYDLNMPVQLPPRPNPSKAFHGDCPITEMGHSTSQMIGRGCRIQGVMATHIFSSPSLRCLQTAMGITRTLNMPLKIRIEPGLYENVVDGIPKWMTQHELAACNITTAPDYEPVIGEEELRQRKGESPSETFERLNKVMDKILEKNEMADAILIIGHACTVDGVGRMLLQKKPSQMCELEYGKLGSSYPYTCVVALEELKNKAWKGMHTPIPHITYNNTSNRINTAYFNRPN